MKQLFASFVSIPVLCMALFFTSCKEKEEVSTTGIYPSALRIVQLCDPQLGYGEGGFDGDVANLEKAVMQINELTPDMVIITGDMVNDNNIEEETISTFHHVIAHIKAPVLLTPGNNDIPSVTTAGLQYYRDHFGNDFRVVECKGRCIISANSQLWWKENAPQEEVSFQDYLLLKTLRTAKNREQPVVMVTHIPPFNSSAEEDDDYFNLPKSKRKEALDLCKENNVFLWLAGHTHTTSKRNYGPITILNGETTSRNFDGRPLGFRLLTIFPDNRFDWEFIPLN